jgi:hypothetical protein
VLLAHLTGAYPDGVRDGIARALAVPEARPYWSILKQAYLDEPLGTRTKQGLAAALAAAADDEVLDELISLVTTPQHGESRGLLMTALPRSYNPLARQVLESMTSDPELRKVAKVLLRARRSRRSPGRHGFST